ncbi:hypothetical protein FOCC_FOCC008983 [Frankliniella occidentalis]|nr:hypothetical protein FOCC_FOCC008983 [Frankliniella occidentalis]
MPLLGWHRPEAEGQQCYFTRVMDYNYLVFLYFFTIIFPALILAAFYAHIYQVVLKQLRRMERQSPGGGIRGGAVCGVGAGGGGGTMLRVLGAARKREVKATQNLSIIVLFFVLCWFPLYTINCVQAFCPECYVPPAVLDCCIILSHLNSAGNPLLYAYHLKDFRAALRALLVGPGLGPDAALDFGNTGVTALSAASRTPLALQRNNVVLCTPSASPVPGLMVPLSTISRTCTGSLWSLQPRYAPALPLTPSRSASDLGSASPSGSESGTEIAVATEKDGHLAAPLPRRTRRSPRSSPLPGPRPGPLPLPRTPTSPVSPRSPKPRLSPLRAVGEFFTGCSWKEDVNGKASKASSVSTEPLDIDAI